MSHTTEFLDLSAVRIDPRVALRVPAVVALRRQALVFGEEDGFAVAALADPGDASTLEALERATGKPVRARGCDPEALRHALNEVYGRLEPRNDDDAVHRLDGMLHSAVVQRASDLHFEPVPDGMRVRMRVDGQLEPVGHVDPARVPGLVNRVKVLANLDISEHRSPQDGSFRWRYGRAGFERNVDVRVACMPVRFGQRLTLRLLVLDTRLPGLEGLGLEPADLNDLRRAADLPHGLVVVTGPTGSGKSTTLHSLLRTLDTTGSSILTIEDPIEYVLEGASQVETDGEDRLSFSRALRGLLRHDPDVLVIGEIRDTETADVAVKATLTGHRVYSTLHTATAIGAVTRLIDLGVAPYLVANTLRLCVAQRLVRRLCHHCRAPRPLSAAEARALGAPEHQGAQVFDGVGCAYCKGVGFSGRSGVFELVRMRPETTAAIARGAAESELLELARAGGSRSLREAALHKVLSGETDVLAALHAVEVEA